jgi:CRP-like cAMP-binding protein
VEEGFLAALSADDRMSFEALGSRRQYPAGQVLFSEGDEGRDVFMLLDGNVKVVSTAASGREVILEVIDHDELIGEMSAIDGQARSATAIALTPVNVLVIPTPRFLEFLQQNGSAATALLQLIVARLRNSSQRQLEFGTSDALGRLCACLLRMLDRYGDDADDRGGHVTIPLAQHEIAAMTGLSREAVVKGLRSMRALGWIDLQARELTVRDEEAMRQRASA